MNALKFTVAAYSVVGVIAGAVAFAIVCGLIQSGYRRPTLSEFLSMMSIPFIVGVSWPYWAFRIASN